MISTIFTRLKITSFRGFAEFLRDVDGLTGGIKRRAEEKHNRPRRPLSCLGQMSNSRALARERARSSKRRIEWREGGRNGATREREKTKSFQGLCDVDTVGERGRGIDMRAARKYTAPCETGPKPLCVSSSPNSFFRFLPSFFLPSTDG